MQRARAVARSRVPPNVDAPRVQQTPEARLSVHLSAKKEARRHEPSAEARALPVRREPSPQALETRALLKAAAPIDIDDPVDGILVEAGCTLGVVLTALEAMGADAHDGEAGDVFTLLLALQRRLAVARELRRVPAEAAENDAHGAGDELAPGAAPLTCIGGACQSSGVAADALDMMHAAVIALSSMVTNWGPKDAVQMAERLSADVERSYERAMTILDPHGTASASATNAAHDAKNEPAPTSSSRPSSSHAVDARDERTRTVDGAGDTLQETLDDMHGTIVALTGMVTAERAEHAARLLSSANSAYARAMHARRTLLAEAISL